MFISVVWSEWLEGSISKSSLQFHFLQTLEHRTDVSVTSTSPWWEAPEEQGVSWVPAGPCGMCWGPSSSPHCPALSPDVSPAPGWVVPVVPLVGGGAWHHLVPQVSLVQPCSPSCPPACPCPTGVRNLWICSSETPTELHPSECSLLLARLELKG